MGHFGPAGDPAGLIACVYLLPDAHVPPMVLITGYPPLSLTYKAPKSTEIQTPLVHVKRPVPPPAPDFRTFINPFTKTFDVWGHLGRRDNIGNGKGTGEDQKDVPAVCRIGRRGDHVHST